MAQDDLERYVELKKQIGELEKELDALKEVVFKSVDDEGGEVANESQGYTIRSYKSPKYKFSKDYETKSDELKALRKSEIEDGTATVDGFSEYVKITFKKAKTAKKATKKKKKS